MLFARGIGFGFGLGFLLCFRLRLWLRRRFGFNCWLGRGLLVLCGRFGGRRFLYRSGSRFLRLWRGGWSGGGFGGGLGFLLGRRGHFLALYRTGWRPARSITPMRVSSLAAVSEGWAPFCNQWTASSSFTTSVTGSDNGS